MFLYLKCLYMSYTMSDSGRRDDRDENCYLSVYFPFTTYMMCEMKGGDTYTFVN
jgi:hypothetical protein